MEAVSPISTVFESEQESSRRSDSVNWAEGNAPRSDTATSEAILLQDLNTAVKQCFRIAITSRFSLSSTQSEAVQINASRTNDEEPGSISNLRSAFRKSWLWECIACFFSLACLATIFGVLVYENGRRLDEWLLTIPPNAVIAFIALLAKGSLVLVLSSTLSQLKWLSFENAQYIKQLKSFDRASRGPLGSLLFLWKSRPTSLIACLAALLMLFALLLDPFVQIVLSFPSELATNSSLVSTFPRTSVYDSENNLNPDPFPYLDNIVAGINNGIFHVKLQESFTCPSGNCLWPNIIKTLAIDGHCDNITTQLQRQCVMNKSWDEVMCTYQFPSGTVKEITSLLWEGTGMIKETTVWNSSINTTSGPVPLASVAAAISLPNSTVQAQTIPYDGILLKVEVIKRPFDFNQSVADLLNTEGYVCEFHWSEKVFQNIRVNNGNLSYTSTTQELWSLQSPHGVYLFSPRQLSTLEMSEPQTWAPYKVNDFWLQEFLGATFFFSYPFPAWVGATPDTDTLIATSPDINATVFKIGESLTELIRTGGNSTNVPGQTMVPTAFIRVRWAWLTLPLALWLLTAILLIVTVAKSHYKGVNVWKDDPIALLLHRIDGLDEDLSDATTRNTPADVERLAKKIVIKRSRDVPLTFTRTNPEVLTSPNRSL